MIQANEVLIIAVVALIFLGPNRLPVAARSIGKAFREFRKVSATVRHEIDEAVGEPIKEFKETVSSFDPTKPASPPASGSEAEQDAASTESSTREPQRPNSAYRPADELIDDDDDLLNDEPSETERPDDDGR